MFGEGWDTLLNNLLDIIDTVEVLKRGDESWPDFNERLKSIVEGVLGGGT